MPDAQQKYFAPRPQSVKDARDFAASIVTSWGLDDTDIRLCVSELATNALLHGSDTAHGFLVRLEADDRLVRLEVHDIREECTQQLKSAQPAATDLRGRGLLIVETLAADWGVERRRPRGKVVWTHFKPTPKATCQAAPC
ncbi:ATP-binding protein [Streptomyces sp. ISL-43]|uniref:ATP-binding protein n=1 Tax=Streptomyces sp. ISL-43 TaxID=2819183 RepID=UPI001BE83810|nr:ATP-binding protein [Streptomyces sp. ISL-43]MBT2446835.1 ATP-binding protein [Streptomyces sp. ISL-43]